MARRNRDEESCFDFIAGTKCGLGIFQVRAGQHPVVYSGLNPCNDYTFCFQAETFFKEHGHWCQRVEQARIDRDRDHIKHVSTMPDPV